MKQRKAHVAAASGCGTAMLALIAGMSLPFPAGAAETHSGDFFGDVATETTDATTRPEAPPPGWSVSGFVKQQFVYALDDQDASYPFSREQAGLTQARSTVNLAMNGRLPADIAFRISVNGFYDAYVHHAGKDERTQAEYDDQADEAELREAFFNLQPLKNFWIKVGRQIVAWGESDFTQILDLANPRDQRELGLVDLEDARLPISATRLSYVGNRWGTDLVVKHEFAANRLAARGSDFDPYIGLRPFLDIRDDQDPDSSLGRGDMLWRGFASLPRGDVGLIVGRVHDHNPVLRSRDGGATYVPAYPRIDAIGLTANFVAGSWLFKTEYARKKRMPFARDDWPAQLLSAAPRLYENKPLDQWLLGFEYAGFDDTQLSLESVTSRIGDYESLLSSRRTETVVSGRYRRNFRHDTASFELVWAHWTELRADSYRLTFSYDLTDAMKFSIGGIVYATDETAALLYPYRRNDRAFTSLRYSF